MKLERHKDSGCFFWKDTKISKDIEKIKKNSFSFDIIRTFWNITTCKKAALNESPSKKFINSRIHRDWGYIDFMLFLATHKLVHDFNQFTTIIAWWKWLRLLSTYHRGTGKATLGLSSSFVVSASSQA
jgi:hypothetical protein